MKVCILIDKGNDGNEYSIVDYDRLRQLIAEYTV